MFAVGLSCSKNIQKCLLLPVMCQEIASFLMQVSPPFCSLFSIILLTFGSTGFSEDLKLLLPIISNIQLHLQRCLDLPLPKAGIENNFDFLDGAVYSCHGLGKTHDKFFLSFIFLHFYFLVPSFLFSNVLNFTYYIFATVFIMNCTQAHSFCCGKCTTR